MGPARAMGTVLKTWRTQWTRLSRAQLALSVSALCEEQKRVTGDIVREWEDGQPPKTTAELHALLQVMRRNGLTEAEAQQFRQAVFASCLDRQYPELFAGENLAHRSDVDAVAHGIWRRQEESPTSVNLVSLVAGISELEEALNSALRPTYAGSPARKQAVALAYLRAAFVKLHGLSNRFTEVVRAATMNAEFLNAHFGTGGLGEHYYLCSLGQQLMDAERGVGRRPESFARLVDIAEQAMDRGHKALARHAMFSAMECLGEEPGASVDALHYHWQRVLGRPLSLEMPADDDPWNHRHLFRACLQANRPEQAEEHLVALHPWRHDTQVRGCVWHLSAGELAMREGRHDEAAGFLRKGWEIAKTGGFVRARESAERHLARCEAQPHSAPPPKRRAKRT